MSEPEIKKIKQVYKQGLDVEQNGRISLEYVRLDKTMQDLVGVQKHDVLQMAKLLPVELGLFVLFRSESRTKTAVEFMEVGYDGRKGAVLHSHIFRKFADVEKI